MMLVRFDARGFADEVSARLSLQGPGARYRATQRTGIPATTFKRMIDGTPPRQIDAILTAAAYFDIRLAPFVKVDTDALP